jgi:hypothetical protein
MGDTEKPIVRKGAPAPAADNQQAMDGAPSISPEHELGRSEQHPAQHRVRPTEALAPFESSGDSPGPAKVLAPTLDEPAWPPPAVSGQAEPVPGPGHTVPGEPPIFDPLPEPAHGYGVVPPGAPAPPVAPPGFGASAQAPIPSPFVGTAGPVRSGRGGGLVWLTLLIGSFVLALLAVGVGALLWHGRTQENPPPPTRSVPSTSVPSTSLVSEIVSAPPSVPSGAATAPVGPKVSSKATPKAKPTTRASSSPPPKPAPGAGRATRTRPTGMR